MSEVHELKTLTLEGERFNSFPDQKAREDILKKIPNPENAAKAGQYLRVLSVDEDGNITAVEAADVKTDSGGNVDYVLPVGGTELGGVKNGGNVVINDDGTMTAPESTGGTDDYTELTNKPKINGVELNGEKSLEDLGIGQPTAEQVGEAVSAYLDEHPEATTTIADGSVTPEKISFIEKPVYPENIYATMEPFYPDGWTAYPWASPPINVKAGDVLTFQGTASVFPDFEIYESDRSTLITKVTPGNSRVFSIAFDEDKEIYLKAHKNVYNNTADQFYIHLGGVVEYPLKTDEYTLDESVTTLAKDIVAKGESPFVKKSNNLYDGSALMDGTIGVAANRFWTGLIPADEPIYLYLLGATVKPGDDSSVDIVSVYDKNRCFVGTRKVTTHKESKFFDPSDDPSIGYISMALFIDGTAPTWDKPEERLFVTTRELNAEEISAFKDKTLSVSKYAENVENASNEIAELIFSSDKSTEYKDSIRFDLMPKFTFIGELWGKKLGNYQAWGFNDLKWDANKKRFVMLMHDANGHGDGNTNQVYLKEINPYTFEYTDLPRIQVNGANIRSYGFEILDNGNYIGLTSYDGAMRLLTSVDGGQTFTVGEAIQDLSDIGMHTGTYHPFALMKLSNGRLFISCDTAQNELLYSDDSGATWKIATIPMGDITYTMTEPDLTELDNEGTVMMLARSSRAVDRKGTDLAEAIFSISYDYGTTWETAQLSEIRSNCSDATALVHDGIVEVFACNKYCPVGGAGNRITALVEATGYEGDIRRYYATIEEAKQNIWHYAGIMGFAQTKNPGYDMGSPCCCMTPNGDIWVGFYDKADDTTKASVLYRWFVAHKNGSYNFAKGIQEIAMRMNN